MSTTTNIKRPEVVAMIHIQGDSGATPVYTIDDEGNLWSHGQLVTGNCDFSERYGLRQRYTRTALDGSLVTLFSTRFNVDLKRFRKDGRTWWAVDGTLCTPRDIAAVRKEIVSSSASRKRRAAGAKA